MNWYDLHRMRLNFRFDNPDKCKSIHSELFMYICDLWNRLWQKKQFWLPTQVTMELLGIWSYNTYTKAYQDLVDWWFIKEIQKSINQYSSRIIAISKIDKATYKALDKATIKATDETTDDIIKQITTKQITTNKSVLFSEFISQYPNKDWRSKAEEKYPIKEHDKIILWLENQKIKFEALKRLWEFVPNRPMVSTWINQKRWLDHQDTWDIKELEFDAIYQEYAKDYENNYAENWKKKYWVSHDPDSLFMRCKKRWKDEGLFR